MTGEPNIDYDALALEAMRGLVRTVLVRTAKTGLPGEHHFYISFDTEAPGVTLSKRLKERYPREMTIVLQHRFWDLIVTDERFEVKLSFDSIPERLVVPFAAIKVFFDPSVQYGLRFEDGDGTGESIDASQTISGAPTGPRAVPRSAPKKPRNIKKPKNDRDTLVAVSSNTTPSPPLPMTPRPVTLTPVATAPAPATATAATTSDNQDKPANGSAQILSLDQFRKK